MDSICLSFFTSGILHFSDGSWKAGPGAAPTFYKVSARETGFSSVGAPIMPKDEWRGIPSDALLMKQRCYGTHDEEERAEERRDYQNASNQEINARQWRALYTGF